MTNIGQIKDRQILYTNIRVDQSWFDKLPNSNWLAFTIADTLDKDLLSDTTKKCLDKNVLYTCSAGQLGSDTEDYFDEEIVWRQVQIEEQTGKPLCFIWAGLSLLGFCLLTCTFISLFSSGSGRTSNEFQPCSKPCPLWATLETHLQNTGENLYLLRAVYSSYGLTLFVRTRTILEHAN